MWIAGSSVDTCGQTLDLFSTHLDIELLQRLAIALFIGGLVGVEREHRGGRDPMHFGGLRTFILVAETGAVAALLSTTMGSPWVFAVFGIGMALMLAAAYLTEARHADYVPGLTTEVAALVTFLLGGLTIVGAPEVAVALAIVTSAALTFKSGLHRAVRTLGRDDISAGLKLLFATFIVLPILPDHPVDPLEVLNPYRLWWLVILISSLSLVGYIAVRMLGPNRGLAVTGIAGGLVSSTAITLSFARRSVEESDLRDALSAGILVAWAIMFLRVMVEVAVVHPPMLRHVGMPMGVLFGVGLILTLWFYRRGGQPGAAAELKLQNPFNLTSASQFGLFFAAVLVAVELARTYVSDDLLYVVSALAGATDVDAITLSMANLAATDGIGLDQASICEVVACLSNSVVKCGMVVTLGHKRMVLPILLSTLILGGAAAGSLAVAFF